jgi:Na+/proline symporter
MISFYDYLNIAFYICFIIGVGIVFSRKSKNTSDYFRGGGVMPWWVAGASAWMASFSAWTFTGAAGKIYETGPYVIVLYYGSLLPLVFILVYTCYRFRRMRVVTPLEAVRLRFGSGVQQFYTWVRLPILFLFGGVGLNSVGVFMSGAFGVNLVVVMIVLGLLVTFVAMLGGAYSVVANDFVQMFLVVTVAVVVAFLSLHFRGVGGLRGLVAQAPHRDFHWGDIARPSFIMFWFIAFAVTNLFGLNSIDASGKYLMAAGDRQARLMLTIPLIGTLLGPVIWIIPPMVTSITHTDVAMAREFPQLSHPHEAAFLAAAIDVLPQGMVGLLICGIFASTVTNMDASLNQGVGILVRNFYLPVINPNCPEKKLLVLSKICTALFGLVNIVLAILVNHFRTAGLFDFLNRLGVGLMLPMAMPLALGLFFRRTPSWSTWTTVLIGWILAYFINFHTDVSQFGALAGFHGPFTVEEANCYKIFAPVAAITLAGVSWFFFTSLFYESSSAEYKASVDEFFARLRAPVQKAPGEATREDLSIASSIGRLCLIYGTFILVLVAIPNPVRGRLCFLFCGGAMVAVGVFLVRRFRGVGPIVPATGEANASAAVPPARAP